jgi:hypothetical protein
MVAMAVDEVVMGVAEVDTTVKVGVMIVSKTVVVVAGKRQDASSIVVHSDGVVLLLVLKFQFPMNVSSSILYSVAFLTSLRSSF